MKDIAQESERARLLEEVVDGTEPSDGVAIGVLRAIEIATGLQGGAVDHPGAGNEIRIRTRLPRPCGQVLGVRQILSFSSDFRRREQGLAEETLVWFCSDNGGAFPLSTGGLPGGKKWLIEGGTRVPGILEWPARVPKTFVTSVPACTMDFYPTALDLLGIAMPDEAGPIDGISLLPLIDGKMKRRPKPIPLVSGQQVRLIDNEFILQKRRLLRFDEDARKDIDITEENPEVHQRLTELVNEWRKSVEKDRAAYAVKRR